METSLVDNAESNLPTDVPDFERTVDGIVEPAGKKVSEGSDGQGISETKDEVSIESGLLGGEAELKRTVSEDEVDGLVGSGQGGEGEQDQPDKVSEVSSLQDAVPEQVTSATGAPDGLDEGESSGVARAVTPGSRTSTPPPGTAHLAAPKKFSAVNVTKKFLSKTGQPAASPASASKLGINGRPAASPVAISSTSSRLLSTKLTTAPLSKSSSPNPPAPGAAPASSSPWAKPVLPTATTTENTQQQAPKRALPNMPAVMGQGQGIASSKPLAWKSVVPEGRSRMGMSREFPTTREIAEGKMAAQMAAQAQAAHNQALLQSLNAFTHLDSAHRWDDEDDEDDVIDFGDNIGIPQPSAPSDPTAPVPSTRPERFVTDDFDRSWPRKQIPTELPRRPEEGGSRDRVLFNASSNRLEPSAPRQPVPAPAPTRLMSRGTEGSIRPPIPTTSGPTAGAGERQLPPHLQQLPSGSGPATGQRALPPHMAGLPAESSRAVPPAPSASGRSAWNIARQSDRPLAQESRETLASNTTSALPPRPSQLSQTLNQHPPPPTHRPSMSSTRPEHIAPMSQAVQPDIQQPQQPPAAPVDDQSAEMHTAAERARLRRLAEEAERNAAAERARKKAKELEERLGIKPAETTPTAPVPPQPAQPIVPAAPSLLRRPAPPPGIASGETGPPPNITQPQIQATAPVRPAPTRPVESSWRSRRLSATNDHSQPKDLVPPTIDKPTLLTRKVDSILEAHAQAEPAPREAIQAGPVRDLPPDVDATPGPIEATAAALVETIVRLPGHPKVSPAIVEAVQQIEQPIIRKENGFDSMLAKIQAAMAQARIVPPPQSQTEPVQESTSVPESDPSVPKAIPKSATTAAPSQTQILPRPLIPEYFNATGIEPPKSPPPAWRTYSVRLPPSSASSSSRKPISPIRIKESETPRSHPTGWLFSFVPPLDIPSNRTLADHLLHKPLAMRLGRQIDSAPMVSISPRRLERFERKKKRVVSPMKSPVVEVVQPPAIESLIAPTPAPSSYLWQQGNRAASGSGTAVTSWPNTDLIQKSDTLAAPAHLTAMDPIKKPRSPIKSSPAAKAEKNGLFAQDAVTVGPIERARPTAADLKPGVRFMVSSELDGDSLLDEVNKMSLETVGEGTGDGKEELPKTPGSETPKTPPSLSGTSSRGLPASPAGTSTPWSRASVRSSTQHDHLKSVWDLAGSTESTANSAPSRPTEIAIPPPLQSNPSQSAQSDVSAPLYASLNAPPSSELPIAQPLPTSKSTAYNAQPYPISPNAFMRPSSNPAIQGYYSPSPVSADAYHPRPNGFSAGTAGTAVNTAGQGVWSPAAFGASMTSPGYGYSGKPQETKGVQPGYGYNAFVQAQQYTGHAYGANAYRQASAGGYGYGYPHQSQSAANSGVTTAPRFAGQQPHANGEYAQYAEGVAAGAGAAGGGGYYGGIGAQQSPVYGQQIVHSQHPHNSHHQTSQQQQQQQYGAGAVGQQILRGGRKMW